MGSRRKEHCLSLGKKAFEEDKKRKLLKHTVESAMNEN